MARVKALLRRGDEGGGWPGSGGRGYGGGEVAAGEGVLAGTGGGSGWGTGTEVLEEGMIARGELIIDRDKKKVTIRGKRLELTPKRSSICWC